MLQVLHELQELQVLHELQVVRVVDERNSKNRDMFATCVSVPQHFWRHANGAPLIVILRFICTPLFYLLFSYSLFYLLETGSLCFFVFFSNGKTSFRRKHSSLFKVETNHFLQVRTVFWFTHRVIFSVIQFSFWPFQFYFFSSQKRFQQKFCLPCLRADDSAFAASSQSQSDRSNAHNLGFNF